MILNLKLKILFSFKQINGFFDINKIWQPCHFYLDPLPKYTKYYTGLVLFVTFKNRNFGFSNSKNGSNAISYKLFHLKVEIFKFGSYESNVKKYLLQLKKIH